MSSTLYLECRGLNWTDCNEIYAQVKQTTWDLKNMENYIITDEIRAA